MRHLVVNEIPEGIGIIDLMNTRVNIHIRPSFIRYHVCGNERQEIIHPIEEKVMTRQEEMDREIDVLIEQVRQDNAKTVQRMKDSLRKDADTAQERAEEYVSKTYPQLKPPD